MRERDIFCGANGEYVIVTPKLGKLSIYNNFVFSWRTASVSLFKFYFYIGCPKKKPFPWI